MKDIKKIYSTQTNNINIALNDFNIINRFENDVDLVIFNEYIDIDVLDLVKVKGIKFFGGNRLTKLHQYFLLSRLNIYTPKTYCNIYTNNTISSIDELNAFVELDEFIVKPPNGARGVGVKKITRQEWKDCNIDNKKVYTIFKDEFTKSNGDNIDDLPLDNKEIYTLKHKYEDVSRDYIEYSFNQFIIQEPINVLREFRCLYFAGGGYLTYERVKKEGQFCGNLSHGSTPKIILEGSDDNNQIIRPMLDKFESILKETKFPWISIDLFVDDHQNIGVFEFQMEFGYEGFDYKEVKSKMINCLNYLIKS